MAKRAQPPTCPGCNKPAQLVDGARMYPSRPDLHAKWYWLCLPCGAWCGCHPGTKRSLGVPAGAELRRARSILHHDRLDPLWQNATAHYDHEPESPRAVAIIRNTARSRVYEFLAWKLGLDREDCHTALFDLATCRRAWTALAGADYGTIRAWAKARRARRDADAATAKPEARPHA